MPRSRSSLSTTIFAAVLLSPAIVLFINVYYYSTHLLVVVTPPATDNHNNLRHHSSSSWRHDAPAPTKRAGGKRVVDHPREGGGSSINARRHDIEKEYVPSSTEKYLLEHAVELGYNSTEVWTTDETTGLKLARGCSIWNDPGVSNGEIHGALMSYKADLDRYNTAVRSFEPIPDHIDEIRRGDYDTCINARVHPDGIRAMFPSDQLSRTRKSGYVEPLTPPMRSVGNLCAPPDPALKKNCPPPESRYYRGLCSRYGIMELDYLVHDYEAMCLGLKPHSRRIFIDLGASLNHGTGNVVGQLLDEYERFGFRFDHIYAYEMNFTNPEDVYGSLLAEKYMTSYHWINVGANPEVGHRLNPLHSILEQYNEDDFVVFKMDVDTYSVEMPLARQLLEGDPNGRYHDLIDQFYFEHHVFLSELSYAWGESMVGTIKDSLDLFHGLRARGIPAHFWP